MAQGIIKWNLDTMTGRWNDCVKAFTLIELLVVISIISLLLAILLPSLSMARSQAQKIACRSNLRQYLLANFDYARANNGNYVPAALDIYTDEKKHRWHGVRENIYQPFDPAKGPLASYFSELCLKCPTNIIFITLETSDPDYDSGSGGYGYNMTYIGSTIWKDGYEDNFCKATTKSTAIRQPAQTLMFADTAFLKNDNYVEFSFAEPRYFVIDGEPAIEAGGWEPSPSIHFRHRKNANIGWADGHVDARKMGKYNGTNEDNVRWAIMNLGWFEPIDNTLFDLK
ncbi:MAG: prepilin-type N-terminal cleavage/methylation domain-containing protein [Phycisphaerales bacterium]